MGVWAATWRRMRALDERFLSAEALDPEASRPHRPRWMLVAVIAGLLWTAVSIALMLAVDRRWGIGVAVGSTILVGMTWGLLLASHGYRPARPNDD